MNMNKQQRPCLRCRGSKCVFCHHRGWFDPPDRAAILAAIRGRKGLRSDPKGLSDREYYVWRLARFHGGRDVTMPILAMLRIEGDPFKEDLDNLADEVASAARNVGAVGELDADTRFRR